MKTRSMSKLSKGHSYSVVALLATSLLAAACGGLKTNPSEGYEDLRDAGKPQKVATTTQLVADSVFRRPSVGNDQIALNFQEGKTGAYAFDAGCFYDGVSYNLVAKNLPAAKAHVVHQTCLADCASEERTCSAVALDPAGSEACTKAKAACEAQCP